MPATRNVGQAILPAAAFQAAVSGHARVLAPGERRLKAGGSDKKKNVQVRLTVSAIVPRKLIPKTQRGVTGL